MIIEYPPSIIELIEEFNSFYGEWIEIGYPVESILFSLLQKEKEKNFDLKMKIDRLEKIIK